MCLSQPHVASYPQDLLAQWPGQWLPKRKGVGESKKGKEVNYMVTDRNKLFHGEYSAVNTDVEI